MKKNAKGISITFVKYLKDPENTQKMLSEILTKKLTDFLLLFRTQQYNICS